MKVATHVFLSPGMFGFCRLGSFDYFCHVAKALVQRFEAAGRAITVHTVDVHPTASIRRRAAKLAKELDENALGTGPIHLLGHSTGGLDARLIASPTMNLGTAPGEQIVYPWAKRICSVTTVNTPHYGTPLASFFATVSGQRMLYALSAVTVAALTLGAPPLALTSSLIAIFGRVRGPMGLELQLVDKLVDNVVRLLDEAASNELHAYLKLLRDDQGAIIQLSPEAMDLFQAGVEDNPEIMYQCVMSYAPNAGVSHWAKTLLSPWESLSAPIFATLNRLTSLEHEAYRCAPPKGTGDDALRAKLGSTPDLNANDGVVPLRSQMWGNIAWLGQADHLDVVGHFQDNKKKERNHVDWLCSHSNFTRNEFQQMMDNIVRGMLDSESRLADVG
jgi:triacylglycerol lipase